MKPLTLGSRTSPLAMAQSRLVRAAIAKANGFEADAIPIEGISTTGDRILDRSLQDAGGKGLFTKELDEALFDKRIDVAVHSMKDLPTKLPDGLALVCVPEREDPRDAFICARWTKVADLLEGATIGTASLRRQAQMLNRRPDLKIVMLRGNVATRLRRIAEHEIDATFLGIAGLNRLGLSNAATAILDAEEMLPAVGQGALAIVCRSDDARTRALLAPLDDPATHAAVIAERAFLEVLDGSCRTPIAGYAKIEGDRIALRGEVLTPDGTKRWHGAMSAPLGHNALVAAHTLGRDLGGDIRGRAEPYAQSG